MTRSVSTLTGSSAEPIKIPPWRAVRVAKGKGLRETAAAAGFTPSHLSLVERGKRQLSVEAMARLAEVLDLRELVKLLAPYREIR